MAPTSLLSAWLLSRAVYLLSLLHSMDQDITELNLENVAKKLRRSVPRKHISVDNSTQP